MHLASCGSKSWVLVSGSKVLAPFVEGGFRFSHAVPFVKFCAVLLVHQLVILLPASRRRLPFCMGPSSVRGSTLSEKKTKDKPHWPTWIPGVWGVGKSPTASYFHRDTCSSNLNNCVLISAQNYCGAATPIADV